MLAGTTNAPAVLAAYGAGGRGERGERAVGVDVHDLGEQRGVLAAHLARCGQASRVELIGHQDVAEVFAGLLQLGVVAEVAGELLLAVAANAPLARHQRPVARPA